MKWSVNKVPGTFKLPNVEKQLFSNKYSGFNLFLSQITAQSRCALKWIQSFSVEEIKEMSTKEEEEM